VWGRDRKRDSEVCGSVAEEFQNVRDSTKLQQGIFKAFPAEKNINNAQSSENLCGNLIVR